MRGSSRVIALGVVCPPVPVPWFPDDHLATFDHLPMSAGTTDPRFLPPQSRSDLWARPRLLRPCPADGSHVISAQDMGLSCR